MQFFNRQDSQLLHACARIHERRAVGKAHVCVTRTQAWQGDVTDAQSWVINYLRLSPWVQACREQLQQGDVASQPSTDAPGCGLCGRHLGECAALMLTTYVCDLPEAKSPPMYSMYVPPPYARTHARMLCLALAARASPPCAPPPTHTPCRQVLHHALQLAAVAPSTLQGVGWQGPYRSRPRSS